MTNVLEFNNYKYKEAVYTKLKNTLSNADLLIYDKKFIVALQYERYLDIAPRIILKSTNIKRITNIAKELNIPVFRRKFTSELATNLKVNDYISFSVHKDIAEILAKSLSLKDKKCNKIKNKNWEYYYNKGLFYLSKDAFNTGIIYFIKALKLDTNYKIYYCKARAECELGKFITAIKDYNEAIKLCPDDYRLYYHRGIINGKLDNFKEKIKRIFNSDTSHRRTSTNC